MGGYGPPPVQQFPYPMMGFDMTQGYGIPPAQFGVQQGYPMPGVCYLVNMMSLFKLLLI